MQTMEDKLRQFCEDNNINISLDIEFDDAVDMWVRCMILGYVQKGKIKPVAKFTNVAKKEESPSLVSNNKKSIPKKRK